jgi:hippurate hydrolase
MFWLGTIAPERVTASEREGAAPLPSLHSDLYHPVPEPSIKTGVLALSTAVLNLIGK